MLARMSDVNCLNNRLVWFDTPVADLTRAESFYSAVLKISVHRERAGDREFSVLSHGVGNGGCLVVKPEEITEHGTLNYLNVKGRIREATRLVGELGGKVLEDVHPIGPFGYRSVVLDSEGNRVALHSEVDH